MGLKLRFLSSLYCAFIGGRTTTIDMNDTGDEKSNQCLLNIIYLTEYQLYKTTISCLFNEKVVPLPC